MKVLVAGDRNWTDKATIWYALLGLDTDDVIVVHGACRGADKLAGEMAKELGFEVREYPADWRRYGKGAEPLRNGQMLVSEQPDLVMLFHDDLANSKGTQNMLLQATTHEVPVRIYGSSKEDSDGT